MIYSGFEGRYSVEMSDSFVEKLNFQAMIKSVAIAASRRPKSRECRTAARLAGDGLGALPWSFLPWIRASWRLF